MKTKKSILLIAAIALLPLATSAQSPPPNPPNPPPPPGPPERAEDRHEKMPKVPVTFLGIETSEVPSVVSEQLGLSNGFGLVVDYVVPDSPAAAAGVQQNDIIKMLNDQILTEPGQLAKLVRSFSEGTNVTLTLLRKGKEQKVTAKLAKKDMPQHPEFGPGHHRHGGFPFGEHGFGDFGMGDFNEQMNRLKDQLGDQNHGLVHNAVVKARDEMMRARDEARQQVERAGDQIRILSKDQDALRATKIDIGKAQIVFSDDKGEMKLETVAGKKLLTAKDPQGKLLFSGPVETKEDLDKMPADVRERYEKLSEHDLPAVASPGGTDEESGATDLDEEEEIPSINQV
jgi:membrane-associated protease RseP (regulator of RpoE activity)